MRNNEPRTSKYAPSPVTPFPLPYSPSLILQSEGIHQLNNRPAPTKGKKKNKAGQISKDMIHRSEQPVRVNQMNAGGWLREEEDNKPNLLIAGPTVEEPESILLDESPFQEDTASIADRKKYVRRASVFVPPSDLLLGTQIDSRRH